MAAPVVDISDPDDDILGGAIEEIESALAVPPARPAPQQRRTEPSFGPDSFERFLDPGPAAVPAARQSDDLKALEDEMEQLLNNLSNPPRR